MSVGYVGRRMGRETGLMVIAAFMLLSAWAPGCSGDEGKNVGADAPGDTRLPWDDVHGPFDGEGLRGGDSSEDLEQAEERTEPDLPGETPCALSGHGCGSWTLGGTLEYCGGCPDQQYCSGDGKCVEVPDCDAGLARFFDLNLAGEGDTMEAGPGEIVPITIGWEVGNAENCAQCERDLVVGYRLESSQPHDNFVCRPLGIVTSCPFFDQGFAAAHLQAPTEPGIYPLYAQSLSTAECVSPAYAFGPSFTTMEVGKLIVKEPCGASTCTALGKNCGEWPDGCGDTVSCGVCGPGFLCDQGQCVKAAACELDLFELTELYVNGFQGNAEVEVMDDVPVLFAYKLGSSTDLDGASRQVVLGIDNKALACAEAGIPDTCPLFGLGMGSGKLTAPATAGTYSIFAVATAAEDCDEAMPIYTDTFPRLAVGTVTTTGQCQVDDCLKQGRHCGDAADGCGDVLYCGQCMEGQTCTAQGLCTNEPDCSQPLFALDALDLNGQGIAAVAGAGALVPVALGWKVGNPDSCVNCTRQIVIGFDSAPAVCFDLGEPPTCPEYDFGGGGRFFHAPPYPGTYPVYAALLEEYDCEYALEQYALADRITVGKLTVEGGCSPAGCQSMGKECGNWGDGCGGLLHCGYCNDELVCSKLGACESQCVDGIFDITGLSINGSGKTASAAPGLNAQVVLSWQLGNPDDCPDCARQVVVGVENEAGFCVEAGTPPQCPGSATGSKTSHVKAPMAEGSYTLYATAAFAENCDVAMGNYASSTDRISLGVMNVTSGCLPESCLSKGKKCGKWPDGCDNTLDCGQCPGGELCDAMGSCYCTSADAYEPNNTPGQAFDFGTFTDKDTESHKVVVGAVHSEEDWFHMGATDVQWAYMEPYVGVDFGLEQPFEVTVVYRCMDGYFPDGYNEVQTVGCDVETNIDLAGVAGSNGPVKGWVCSSLGGPVQLQFGPNCEWLDDSGDMWVGVESTGECSAYTLDMHL